MSQVYCNYVLIDPLHDNTRLRDSVISYGAPTLFSLATLGLTVAGGQLGRSHVGDLKVFVRFRAYSTATTVIGAKVYLYIPRISPGRLCICPWSGEVDFVHSGTEY